jgi:hypothetical protein
MESTHGACPAEATNQQRRTGKLGSSRELPFAPRDNMDPVYTVVKGGSTRYCALKLGQAQHIDDLPKGSSVRPILLTSSLGIRDPGCGIRIRDVRCGRNQMPECRVQDRPFCILHSAFLIPDSSFRIPDPGSRIPAPTSAPAIPSRSDWLCPPARGRCRSSIPSGAPRRW